MNTMATEEQNGPTTTFPFGAQRLKRPPPMDLSIDSDSDKEEPDFADLKRKATNEYQKYSATGDGGYLDTAVDGFRLALERCPSTHPEYRRCLYDLAICLSDRFKRTSNMADITEAINFFQRTLEMWFIGRPNKETTLNKLGLAYFYRFEQTGDEEDLNQSIEFNRKALELPHHPDRGEALKDLANCLWGRFDSKGNRDDISEAIRLHREALDLCPADHSDRSMRLNSLAICLTDSFERFDDEADLVAAIGLHREALELRPPGHPDRGATLNNLATCLSERAELKDNDEDLAEAIIFYQESLALRPRGHASRASILNNLAQCLSLQLDRSKANSKTSSISSPASPEAESEALTTLLGMLREATLPSLAPIPHRLHAAHTWRVYGQKYKHESELEAMVETLNILDESITYSQSLENLYHQLSENDLIRKAHAVSGEAAALAIERGDIKLGAMLLERGRATIFAQLGRYRLEHDDLKIKAPELARRFKELGTALGDLVVGGGEMKTALRGQDRHTSYYQVYAEWRETIEKIRQTPGLGSFLRPPSYEQLQQAAAGGPVIILNLNERRSDAIIVLSSLDPVLVPLPEASPKGIQTLANRLGRRPEECHMDDLIYILREAWDHIVFPVVTKLLSAPIELPKGSHIWWYPTGAASRLPLHATGPYLRGERNLGNYFVSSYTPTLGALIRARQPRTTQTSTNTLLVVGQPDTPGQQPLPKVVDEVHSIQQHAPHATVLLSSEGTRDVVLQKLGDHSWIHLACHGHHNPTDPFESHFSVYDGSITLRDLVDKDLSNAELAVLSVCHSARVSEVLPDEVLHLAAGMMFSGYKGVIGTMWALDDGLGSALANKFYKLMLAGKSGPKSYTEAAVGLTKAFNALDKDGYKIPFSQRINVVHYGA